MKRRNWANALVFTLLFAIAIFSNNGQVSTEAATDYMNAIELLKTVVMEVGLADKKNDIPDLTIRVYREGLGISDDRSAAVMYNSSLSMSEIKDTILRYNISADDAVYVAAAVKIGLIDQDTFSNLNSRVSIYRASVIMVNADYYLYGRTQNIIRNYLSELPEYNIIYDKNHDVIDIIYDPGFSYEQVLNLTLRIKEPSGGYTLYKEGHLSDSDEVIGFYYIDPVYKEISETVSVDRYPNEELDYVIEHRMSDITELQTRSTRRKFATAYLMGYICGESEGEYSSQRRFTPKAKASRKMILEMIARLTEPDLRYKLSPDKKLCRISDSDLPVTAALYDYILEDFPNSYYDTGYSADGCDTLVEAYRDWKSYEERLTDTGLTDTRDTDNNVIFPCEMPNFLSDISGNGLGEEYKKLDPSFAEQAEEYYMHLLNVDYRTIQDDDEWRQYMSRFYSDDLIELYITDCMMNHTVLECDKVAADHSSVYYCDGLYRCKVYAHMRIVSDDFLIYDTVDDRGRPASRTSYLYLGRNITSWLPIKAGIRWEFMEDKVSPRVSINGGTLTHPDKGEWIDHYVTALGAPLTENGPVELVGGLAVGTLQRDYRYIAQYNLMDHFE